MIYAMFRQVVAAPASLLVIAAWMVMAYVMEIWPSFPSRWIPICCIFGGALTYPLFCKLETVPPEFPIPMAVLVVNGLISGLLAWNVHRYLIKLLIAKFLGVTPDDDPKPKPPTDPKP